MADASATTISLATPSTPAVPNSLCLRCNKNLDPELEYHLCPDLKVAYSPLRMEIDLNNIALKLDQCCEIEATLNGAAKFVDDPKVQAELVNFRVRVAKCHETLVKLHALHAPYRLNEWNDMITTLEASCKALEKRILG